MNQNFTQFSFTESVKKAQRYYGTRDSYARMEKSGDRFKFTYNEISFIESRDSFYMGTVGENGWPYVQFRGGPKGFLKVIDEVTIAYIDFRGNGQYISTGNIKDSNKTSLFLMDYPSQRRLKIWVESTVIEANEDEKLLKKLQVEGYKARIERIVIFKIQAYDWNCPQHITPRYTMEEIREM
jgi:predicted pyridoxine 5'-phosphate oxidase superfamily flavin-nucleotide-binding protein